MIFMLQTDSQNELYIQREITLARQDIKRAAQQQYQTTSTPLDNPIPSPAPIKNPRPPDNITVTAQPKLSPQPNAQKVDLNPVSRIATKELLAQSVTEKPPARILPKKPHAPATVKQPRHSYHIHPPQTKPLSLEDTFIETLLDQIVLDDIQREHHW